MLKYLLSTGGTRFSLPPPSPETEAGNPEQDEPDGDEIEQQRADLGNDAAAVDLE